VLRRTTAMPECLLRAVDGKPGVACNGDECLYWRAVEQIGVAEAPVPQQCAIQHFQLLDGGSDVAAWLLSVKLRVEWGLPVPEEP
jgi:hypothetical protein